MDKEKRKKKINVKYDGVVYGGRDKNEGMRVNDRESRMGVSFISKRSCGNGLESSMVICCVRIKRKEK
jgi:hypothetical protein